MTITAITAACHRPEAWALSEGYMKAQTRKPDQWIVLDGGDQPSVCTMGQEYHYWKELTGQPAMATKIRRAIENNLIKGDILVIWENDDFYAPNYLEWCEQALSKYALIGEGRNLYYNVQHRWWFDHGNMQHASLCATAMTKKAIPTLLRECLRSDNPWIDDRLWKNCKLPKKVFDPHATGKRLSVGIKAMPGLKGYGSGHDKDCGWAIKDPDGLKLRELLGDSADNYTRFYEKPVEIKTIPQPETTPSVEVHIVACNEEMVMPYALRHYKTFASRIVVHDGGSTDSTRDICIEAGVEVMNWDTGGKINDELLRVLKETCWAGTSASIVIVADADELVYFPHGAANTLNHYLHLSLPVVKCRGYEMESPSLPTTTGQIYEEIDHGAPDDRWYGKPCIINPKLIRSIHFTHGAHEANAELLNRRRFIPTTVSTPVAYLLHYKHLGPVERIAKIYDDHRARFSDENKRRGWGWQGEGIVNAQRKRTAILSQRKKIL